MSTKMDALLLHSTKTDGEIDKLQERIMVLDKLATKLEEQILVLQRGK